MGCIPNTGSWETSVGTTPPITTTTVAATSPITPTTTLMVFGAITSETEFVTCLFERFTLESTGTLLVVGMRAVDSATTDNTLMRVMIVEMPTVFFGRDSVEPFIGVHVVRESE